MLKHKLKKTSKRLYSLGRRGKGDQSEEDGRGGGRSGHGQRDADDEEATRVKWSGGGETSARSRVKGQKTQTQVADPGYCTATESLYESGLSDNCRERNEGNITDRDSITLNDSGTHESIVPVAVPWHRRATPEEDMVWTLAGIKALIEQQRQIISCIANNTDKIGQTSDPSGMMTEAEQLVGIDTIRRLLEVEELRKFSEKLQEKLESRQ